MATLTAPYISHSFRSTKHFSRILHRSSIQSVLNKRLNNSINCLTSARNMSDNTAKPRKFCLDMSNINPHIKTMEYAVRYVFMLYVFFQLRKSQITMSTLIELLNNFQRSTRHSRCCHRERTGTGN